jgi:RHS repeat-associated protein
MKKIIGVFFIAVFSFSPLCSHAGAKITYYVNDALGSPVVAMNQAGDVVWRKTYQPYGKASGKDGDNRIGYTGHVEDQPDLVYAGARYYDPALGRFLSDDPVRFAEKNPMSFNRYAYANNNPYKFVDPDGREVFSIHGTLMGERGLLYVNTGDKDSAPSVGVASSMSTEYSSVLDFDMGKTLYKAAFKNIAEHPIGGGFSVGDTLKDLETGNVKSLSLVFGTMEEKGSLKTVEFGINISNVPFVENEAVRVIDKADYALSDKKGDILPDIGSSLGQVGTSLIPH